MVAAAEQWSPTLDDVNGLRHSVEGWVGAGAIAHAAATLGVTLSIEARTAAKTFESIGNDAMTDGFGAR